MNLNLTRCIVFIFLYFFSFLSFRFIFFLLLALSFSLTTATKSSCSRPFLFAYPMPTFFSRSNIFFLCHLDYGILFIHIWLTFINTYKIYYFIIELKHVIKWWKISCALFSYAIILCPFFSSSALFYYVVVLFLFFGFGLLSFFWLSVICSLLLSSFFFRLLSYCLSFALWLSISAFFFFACCPFFLCILR